MMDHYTKYLKPEHDGQWESWCRVIFAKVLGLDNPQKFRGRGFKQFGIDLVGSRADGFVVGVQCKLFTKGHIFTPAEAEEELTKTTGLSIELDLMVFATTCDDRCLQEWAEAKSKSGPAAKVKQVKVYSWPDFEELFNQHSDLRRACYPEMFAKEEAGTIHAERDYMDFRGATVIMGAGGSIGGGSQPPTDNLADAGASKNDAFVGRLIQLHDLSALINDPSGPRAVVIVAGAGFGKTELAKEFINVRAKPATKTTDPDTLSAEHWTGRWWLDGSKGGEVASLKKHYRAITGEPFPDEPKPAPSEDAATVFAAWHTSLRRHIAQACSTGKQLLVVDNAESPAQIAEYRPANFGRVIATTRRQPIPRAAAHTFPLDIMSDADARAMLAGSREDLKDARHAPALDAIAEHLGHHALALAYAGAALARPPHKSPEAVLTRMKQTDIGDEADLFGEFDEEDLGGVYKMGLAQSLGLLLNELDEEGGTDHDQLAARLAEAAAFCDPSEIPISLFVDATGLDKAAVESSLLALHKRSIILLTTTASLHRLTQSLLRSRLKRQGAGVTAAVLQHLLGAMIELFADTNWNDLASARTAMIRHVESVTDYAKSSARAWELHFRAIRLQADLAVHLSFLGQLVSANKHIDAAIAWGEAQSLRNEWIMAIWYGARARIRRDRGDLAGAEADIKKSIDWEEAQSPRDEHSLALGYADRASIRQVLGDLQGAEDDIMKSIDWGESQSPRDERVLAIRYVSRANIRKDRGDLLGAEADIQKSIDWEEAQSPCDERGLAICYALRADIRHRRGDLAGAEVDLKQAIDWFEAQSPRDGRGLAMRYGLRARIRQDRGDYAGAEADVTKCIDWFEAQSPRDERKLGGYYASRASIRRDLKQYATALADVDAALACLVKNPSDYERYIGNVNQIKASIDAATTSDNTHLAIRCANLAMTQLRQGDLPGARANMEQAIAIAETLWGEEHQNLGLARSNLALIQLEQGDLPGAQATIVWAITSHQKHPAPDQPTLAILYSYLATVQLKQGNRPDARTSIEQAIAIEQPHPDQDQPTLAMRYVTLAMIEHDERNKAAACENLKRALGILLPQFGEDHPEVKLVRNLMKTAGCDE